MKTHLIFIGNKFIYNVPLKEYILRNVEQECGFVDMTTSLKDSNNAFFLFLEEALNAENRLIVVTTKQNFATVGKVVCTATNDNQVLREGMLIPQKASLFEERSYLLEYSNSLVNVLQMDENQKMPEILLPNEDIKAVMHVFEEERDTLINILSPISQTYEVTFDLTEQVHGWFRVDIESRKYGDITKFIEASKKLLPKKLIASASIILYIIERLTNSAKQVTFAESCTGGLLSYYFTKNNGASNILGGSLVTYSNALKENWLAVDHKIIEENGAVSVQVVEEMSDGAINVSSADYALSISGIAGDTGGTKEKPVGTVYIGVRSKEQHLEKHLHFYGDRNYVQHQSALMAIKMLLLIDKETFF